MHEQAKIDEARYFYSQMCAVVNDRAAFNFNLSAFLAAARSVLQYTREEAKAHSGGRAWYDAKVSSQPVVKFFKDKRDISIHAEPVVPASQMAIAVSDSIHLSDSLSITICRKDGSFERRDPEPSVPTSEPKQGVMSILYRYFFHDWPGADDVISLCDRYMNAAEAIVSEGKARGFITA